MDPRRGSASLLGAVVGLVGDIFSDHVVEFLTGSMDLSLGIVDLLLGIGFGLLGGALGTEAGDRPRV